MAGEERDCEKTENEARRLSVQSCPTSTTEEKIPRRLRMVQALQTTQFYRQIYTRVREGELHRLAGKPDIPKVEQHEYSF